MQLEVVGSRLAEDVDEIFMEKALSAARAAANAGEIPVGAVLAWRETAVASAGNQSIALSDPTAHAEIIALREAGRRLRNYRLTGSTLYVTVEPCLMCVGALLHARVARVVFGCREPKVGALGSAYDVGRDGRANHRLTVRGGVCAAEASDLLQTFFRMRRGA